MSDKPSKPFSKDDEHCPCCRDGSFCPVTPPKGKPPKVITGVDDTPQTYVPRTEVVCAIIWTGANYEGIIDVVKDDFRYRFLKNGGLTVTTYRGQTHVPLGNSVLVSSKNLISIYTPEEMREKFILMPVSTRETE